MPDLFVYPNWYVAPEYGDIPQGTGNGSIIGDGLELPYLFPNVHDMGPYLVNGKRYVVMMGFVKYPFNVEVWESSDGLTWKSLDVDNSPITQNYAAPYWDFTVGSEKIYIAYVVSDSGGVAPTIYKINIAVFDLNTKTWTSLDIAPNGPDHVSKVYFASGIQTSIGLVRRSDGSFVLAWQYYESAGFNPYYHRARMSIYSAGAWGAPINIDVQASGAQYNNTIVISASRGTGDRVHIYLCVYETPYCVTVESDNTYYVSDSIPVQSIRDIGYGYGEGASFSTSGQGSHQLLAFAATVKKAAADSFWFGTLSAWVMDMESNQGGKMKWMIRQAGDATRPIDRFKDRQMIPSGFGTRCTAMWVFWGFSVDLNTPPSDPLPHSYESTKFWLNRTSQMEFADTPAVIMESPSFRIQNRPTGCRKLGTNKIGMVVKVLDVLDTTNNTGDYVWYMERDMPSISPPTCALGGGNRNYSWGL